MKEFRIYFIFKELKSLFSFIWCHLYTVDIKCLKYYIKKLLLKSNFGQLGILNIWWETNLICYFWMNAVLISVSIGDWDCVMVWWFWFYCSVTKFDLFKRLHFLYDNSNETYFFLSILTTLNQKSCNLLDAIILRFYLWIFNVSQITSISSFNEL